MSAAAERIRVTLHQETKLEFPELWLQVFIAGDKYEQRQFAEMFVRARCAGAKYPDTADLVVFTGGPDVDPTLYGEEAHNQTHVNPERDKEDILLYNKCLTEGIPMLGICRGAQFLHVMNGGKLYQHVDNHYGDHGIYDVREKTMIPKVSSIHHQMVIANPDGGMEVLAQSPVAKNRWCNPTRNVEGMKQDVEAFFYRDTCCLGIQGHPEYRGYAKFTQWTIKLIESCIVYSPDVVGLKTGSSPAVNRLKREFLKERDARWAEKVRKNQS